MTNARQDRPNEPLIEELIRLCSPQRRGEAAQLRRYWSSATRHDAWPILGRLGVICHKADQLTAALFAEHCRQDILHRRGAGGIGRAVRTLGGGRNTDPKFDSTERHFRRLLACDNLDELAGPLHRMVKRLQRHSGGPILLDYNRLLWDLRKWTSDSETIKTEWARDFWQPQLNETQENPA